GDGAPGPRRLRAEIRPAGRFCARSKGAPRSRSRPPRQKSPGTGAAEKKARLLLWGEAMSARVEKFSYDDASVRKFLFATVVWGGGGRGADRFVAGPDAGAPRAQRRVAPAELRPAAPAAHQRGDLRVRRQRDLRGHLSLEPTPPGGAHVQRQAERVPLLGLAG